MSVSKTEKEVEVWKSMEKLGFSKYEASTLGNIRNAKTKDLLNPFTHPSGYTMVSCGNDKGKNKTIRVHILIAGTFLENPDNKPTVHHIDADRSNNKLSNLQYATYKEQRLAQKRPNQNGF